MCVGIPDHVQPLVPWRAQGVVDFDEASVGHAERVQPERARPRLAPDRHEQLLGAPRASVLQHERHRTGPRRAAIALRRGGLHAEHNLDAAVLQRFAHELGGWLLLA
jgi:hypothetical protein